MKNENGGNRSNQDESGKGKVGYKSPPVEGRIKPGEVRNPYGRNGKKMEDVDAFEKVRRRVSRVTIDGQPSLVDNEKSFWLRQWSMALAGDKAAARLVEKRLTAMRSLGPPPPTAQELAQLEAETRERERLSAEIVDALEQLAELKRDGVWS